MKNFLFLTFFVFPFFLILTSCGGENLPDSSTCTPGIYKCTKSGSSQYCTKNETWTISEYCNNGCNINTGKCYDSNSSESDSNEYSECSSGSYRCYGITSQKCSNGYWANYEQCSGDKECNSSTGRCVSKGNSSGNNNGSSTTYKSPYGSLSLNFSIDQIKNESDGNDSDVGTSYSAFATGTYGNSSTSVTPSDAYVIQTSAIYDTDAQYGNSVYIQQIPVYVQNDQGVGGNPVVILNIPEEYAAVGTLDTSLYQGAQAWLYVVDVNWNTGYIDCHHAFGEGNVHITSIGNVAYHGNISLYGNVTLYSPTNYDGNGDITSELAITACNPVR